METAPSLACDEAAEKNGNCEPDRFTPFRSRTQFLPAYVIAREIVAALRLCVEARP